MNIIQKQLSFVLGQISENRSSIEVLFAERAKILIHMFFVSIGKHYVIYKNSRLTKEESILLFLNILERFLFKKCLQKNTDLINFYSESIDICN